MSKTVKELLDYWADIDTINVNGITAVDLLFIGHRMYNYDKKNIHAANGMNYHNNTFNYFPVCEESPVR